jgi:hypothetical protein
MVHVESALLSLAMKLGRIYLRYAVIDKSHYYHHSRNSILIIVHADVL